MLPDVTPVFIGLDLAWSGRNPTGGAVIRGHQLVALTGELGSDEELIDFVSAQLAPGTPAVVAVDAPLRVPNQSGSRLCDRAVTGEWGRYHAGALPANRTILDRYGGVRGEELVQKLGDRLGFCEAAPIPLRGAERYVCEVFPHPAHVSLFDLERIFKYKGRGRAYPDRWAEYERYRCHLLTLEEADPPLVGADAFLAAEPIQGVRGKALQRLDDRMDALTCAYVAAYLWRHGPARTRVYGSVEAGHILTPVSPAMARRLNGRGTG